MSALLFVTCIVDQLYPEVGESTVRLLSRLGVDLEFPEAQTCCGQPAFNSGYWGRRGPSRGVGSNSSIETGTS